MPQPRHPTLGPTATSAPTTSRDLPEDWKLEAACSSYTGPLDDLPTSLCAVCPVQEPCGDLYLTVQAMLVESETQHTSRQQLGGVWGGIPRFDAPVRVAQEYGDLEIRPCSDECDEPTFARGACREHYNKQYWAARQEGYYRAGPSTRTCTVDDCEEKHAARGMCSHHYHKWRMAQKALGNKPEKPSQASARPIDEPTYAGYSRAVRAGRDPTEAQRAAKVAYGHERWERMKASGLTPEGGKVRP